MALSQSDVQGIADYARIALAPDELEQMTAYMNSAVELLEPIRALAEKAAPTSHPIGSLSNVMRPDEVRASLDLEDALYNATSKEGRFFSVPAILASQEDGDLA